MTTYNPVLQPTLLDRLAELYWNSSAVRIAAQGTFCLTGVAVMGLLAVAFA